MSDQSGGDEGEIRPERFLWQDGELVRVEAWEGDKSPPPPLTKAQQAGRRLPGSGVPRDVLKPQPEE